VHGLAFYRGMQVVGANFEHSAFDGVLGLDRSNKHAHSKKKAQKKASFNLLRAAREAKAIPRALVAFMLRKPPMHGGHVLKTACDGFVSVGGYRKEHYKGELVWHDVLHVKGAHRHGQWLLRVKSLTVGKDSPNFCGAGGCEALLDSGTSSLRMPGAAAIAERLDLTPECASLKSQKALDFHIGDKKYSLSAAEATYVMDNPLVGSVCKSNIELPEVGRKTSIVLGAPFFERYFVVFDNEDQAHPRIGIAEAHHGALKGCHKNKQGELEFI